MACGPLPRACSTIAAATYTGAWERYGDPFERAHALDGMARCLSALGMSEDAALAEGQAGKIFSSLGIPDTLEVP